MTNAENVRDEDRTALAQLRSEFPKSGALWDPREHLRAIFEGIGITTAAEGRARSEQWMARVRLRGLSAREQFCATLTNWMDGTADSFGTRSTNGRTEGFNHGLRAILWRAYGMLSFDNFRLRVGDRFGRAKY